MSALDDLKRALANVVSTLDTAIGAIDLALNLREESEAALGPAIDGTRDDDALDALKLHTAAADDLVGTRETVATARNRIETYRSHIGGKHEPRKNEPAKPSSSARPRNVVGVDGSEYPPEAAWAVPELPPRVKQKGDHTVGKITIGDRPIPGAFRSDTGDVWVQEATQRIRDLGIRAWPYVPYHVEMRAAAMMVRSGVTAADVVINNVPCGYQNSPPGCHQALEPFLPDGSQMTVCGTDSKGRPYRRTYHGKAKR